MIDAPSVLSHRLQSDCKVPTKRFNSVQLSSTLEGKLCDIPSCVFSPALLRYHRVTSHSSGQKHMFWKGLEEFFSSLFTSAVKYGVSSLHPNHPNPPLPQHSAASGGASASSSDDRHVCNIREGVYTHRVQSFYYFPCFCGNKAGPAYR